MKLNIDRARDVDERWLAIVFALAMGVLMVVDVVWCSGVAECRVARCMMRHVMRCM